MNDLKLNRAIATIFPRDKSNGQICASYKRPNWQKPLLKYFSDADEAKNWIVLMWKLVPSPTLDIIHVAHKSSETRVETMKRGV